MTFLLTVVLLLGPSNTPDPGLPTIPPPLPTQIVNGDGSRMNCTPTYSYCWPAT